MEFTVLSDNHVEEILRTLISSDVSDLASVLEQALVQYSSRDGQKYQPARSIIKRPGGQITLFMPASMEEITGVKISGIMSSTPSPNAGDGYAPPGLKSVLTLCDNSGQAIGILNAATLTGFRTALGSILMYRFRQDTENIVIFGAGKQAQWHILLAIAFRGKDIRRITIVNRSVPRARALVDALLKDSWPPQIELSIFNAQLQSESSLEELVADADALFLTTPSTEPIFPAHFLTSAAARKKLRFISAIGSYRLDMQEIDPVLLREVVDPRGMFAAAAYQGGKIVVDSREGCLQEAGELAKADISAEKMIEAGEILYQHRATGTAELADWLAKGFLIYKSVGVGIMDLAIGHHLLRLARARRCGSILEGL